MVVGPEAKLVIEQKFSGVQQNPKQVLRSIFGRRGLVDPRQRFRRLFWTRRSRQSGQIQVLDNARQRRLVLQQSLDSPAARGQFLVERVAVE